MAEAKAKAKKKTKKKRYLTLKEQIQMLRTAVMELADELRRDERDEAGMARLQDRLQFAKAVIAATAPKGEAAR